MKPDFQTLAKTIRPGTSQEMVEIHGEPFTIDQKYGYIYLSHRDRSLTALGSTPQRALDDLRYQAAIMLDPMEWGDDNWLTGPPPDQIRFRQWLIDMADLRINLMEHCPCSACRLSRNNLLERKGVSPTEEALDEMTRFEPKVWSLLACAAADIGAGAYKADYNSSLGLFSLTAFIEESTDGLRRGLVSMTAPPAANDPYYVIYQPV